MEVSHSKPLYFVALMICVACLCVSAQENCPASTLTCNCIDNTDDILDLLERVSCLESAMDQDTALTDLVIRDCSDVVNNGSNKHQLSPEGLEPFDALCVFDNDGKWTVIQQRFNADVDFNRAWSEYQQGFGVMTDTGNFWLGLERMHQMTNQRQYTLGIDLQDWDDSWHHAEYSLFRVMDETSKYTLKLDGHSGNLPDGLIGGANDSPFTTLDEDNDDWAANNCAKHYVNAWWHKACFYVALNGPYGVASDEPRDYATGIIWKQYKGYYYSMKSSRMRIRPTFDN